jgi:hypothetical protein
MPLSLPYSLTLFYRLSIVGLFSYLIIGRIGAY